jgi:oligosaccharide amylase
MPVYLPSGAIGNGSILSTLGASGEIMTLFYPRVDFAQNVNECLPALYVGDPGRGTFLWCFQSEFERSQSYVPDTNILTTNLRLSSTPLRITFTDFAPPTATCIVRTVDCENLGPDAFTGTFLHYFDLRLGEVSGKQAVRYVPEDGLVMQYFRDITIIVGGTRADVFRCGKSVAEDDHSAKTDMYDGHLNGQPEDIGQVNFSLGWHLTLQPGETRRIEIIFSCGETREEAQQRFRKATSKGAARLQEETSESAAAWLARAHPVNVEDGLLRAYYRALLSMQLLVDRHTGSFLAAPEFDPAYLQCGGYGYCWPRDATEAAIALRDAGYPEYLNHLAEWYVAAQQPSGLWAQRYWADQHVGPSWSLREDFHQIDQSAAAVIALAEASLDAEPGEPGPALAEYWPAVREGALALENMIAPNGLHKLACDLWETYCGVFVYSSAALYQALALAARCAEAAGEDCLGKRWGEATARMKEAVIALYDRGYFPRGLMPSGHVDHVVDSSTLGLVEPFGLLNLSDASERRMYESNLAMIEGRLAQEFHSGRGIRRYEGDAYLNGVIGCVNTLWMARSLLHLESAYRKADPWKSADLRHRAVDYINFALAHATPTGLLPELIGLSPDTPYWAAPHAWASGLLIKCVLAL